MKFTEPFVSGLKSILSHKLRSILTLAGIVIGVAAVTTMFSSVNAMKQLIEETISSLGYDNVIILYSTFPNSEKSKLKTYTAKPRFKNLTYNDYEVLKSKLNNVEYLYPGINDEKVCIINGKSSKVRLNGVNNAFFKDKNYLVGNGRLFSIIEQSEGQNVCIIGSSLKKKFYPETDALGKFISIGNIRLKIVGVLKDEGLDKPGKVVRGNIWERRRDHESCFIPSKCAAIYLRPNMQIDNIWIKAIDSEKVGSVFNQAKQLLLATHNMADDIEIQDISSVMLEVREQINTQMKNWNIILLCISGISLFTGGIGLFSILLISIRERMKEIGIRKSIGAKNKDIFAHFLLESITLAFMGGIFGSGLALILIKFITSKIEVAFSFPITGIIVGLIFAIIVGFVSGLYPSLKASKIDPIKAIFYTE